MIHTDNKCTDEAKAFVYLLHFDRPIGNPNNKRAQAQHYIGWCVNLRKRLFQHYTGKGAKITQYLFENKIGWSVARVWYFENYKKARDFERVLKRRKYARRICRFCSMTK
ncbi:MAG: GIY-YIG nuclease family protein [Flavobacteriaceae bacterium]|nr:GIY-YIG nuclease family protein [Flavobacteriaceae bacterium]